MTWTIEPAKVVYEGNSYVMELGTITSTMLGYEDHGILTFVLGMDFGSSHQGAGTYGLGEHGEYMGAVVKEILNLFGVLAWEDLKGKRAFALRNRPGDLIRGLMDESMCRVIIFSEVFDRASETVLQ